MFSEVLDWENSPSNNFIGLDTEEFLNRDMIQKSYSELKNKMIDCFPNLPDVKLNSQVLFRKNMHNFKNNVDHSTPVSFNNLLDQLKQGPFSSSIINYSPNLERPLILNHIILHDDLIENLSEKDNYFKAISRKLKKTTLKIIIPCKTTADYLKWYSLEDDLRKIVKIKSGLEE